MKTIPKLKKAEVIQRFGGAEATATALGYASRDAVDAWPSVLSTRQSLMCLGAMHLVQQESAPVAPVRARKRRSWLVRRAA